MNAAGWLVMVLSVGSVLSLVSYCLYRVLTLPPVEVEDHLKAPPDIDTGDMGPDDDSATACAHCHKLNNSRSKYCGYCGHALDT